MDPQNESQQTQAQSLCVGNCGFWGSQETGGYCSVCFKKQQSAALAAATAPQAPAAQPAAAQPPSPPKAEAAPQEAPAEAPVASPAAAPADAPAAEPEKPADDKPVQENRGRCFCCRKKVGLLGFECRCGYVYCSGHRHAQDHACTFDYAAFDKSNLAKANQKVVAAKVDKL